MFKEVLHRPTESSVINYVSNTRSELTKNFLVDRSRYIEQLYAHHKRKIERRVQIMRNRQTIGIDEYSYDDEKKQDPHKPVNS